MIGQHLVNFDPLVRRYRKVARRFLALAAASGGLFLIAISWRNWSI